MELCASDPSRGRTSVPRAAVPTSLNELELTHSPALTSPATTNPDPSLRRLRNQLLAARADIDHALTRLGGLQSEFLPLWRNSWSLTR